MGTLGRIYILGGEPLGSIYLGEDYIYEMTVIGIYELLAIIIFVERHLFIYVIYLWESIYLFLFIYVIYYEYLLIYEMIFICEMVAFGRCNEF